MTKLWKGAVTVRGIVPGKELGATYVHEHLIVKPQIEEPKYLDYTLEDVKKSTQETQAFFQAGGRTLVEMTPMNYGRDVQAYKTISEEANVHVICCTGFHKEVFLPSWFWEKTEDALFQLLKSEILNGMDGTHIRPGVVKLGTSYEQITVQEERAIKIVAKAHLETGIPISTHCDKGTMAMEQLDMLEKLGVKPENVLLCHIDSKMDIDYAIQLCQRGAHICIDHVGRALENRDCFRVEMIAELVRHGYADKVMLSGDMGKVNYLKAYGGAPGFTYILTDLKEALLEKITREDYNQIMIVNPRRFFSGEKG
ncbi:phosphotriesterase family protein [Fusibacter ferrireducens]|uniref:Aryldialkylphosphatase n=1 Tax=Fusibacter ferrireducens TaxID=2785058 RepID=A0ABR9ZZA1_9FIRM|nr:aryldialkylphosphatase [Fusibacter ferrireducens]MBF4695774.1 aryldialkylphosphatase [Fusibacter ferrireducens]